MNWEYSWPYSSKSVSLRRSVLNSFFFFNNLKGICKNEIITAQFQVNPGDQTSFYHGRTLIRKRKRKRKPKLPLNHMSSAFIYHRQSRKFTLSFSLHCRRLIHSCNMSMPPKHTFLHSHLSSFPHHTNFFLPHSLFDQSLLSLISHLKKPIPTASTLVLLLSYRVSLTKSG